MLLFKKYYFKIFDTITLDVKTHRTNKNLIPLIVAKRTVTIQRTGKVIFDH